MKSNRDDPMDDNSRTDLMKPSRTMEDNSTTEFMDESHSDALDIRRRASELLDLSERLETHVEHEHEPLSLSRRCGKRVCFGLVILALAIVGTIVALTQVGQKQEVVSAELPAQEENKEDNSTSLCPQDIFECPDGSTVSRNPMNKCIFDTCPEQPGKEQPLEEVEEEEEKEEEKPMLEPTCQPGSKLCTDGTFVNRIGPDCEFGHCAEGACIFEENVCPDGSTVQRDPDDDCKFTPCPEYEQATQEPTDEVSVGKGCRVVKMCTDLTTVQGKGPNCELEACPEGACLVDTFTCPDGYIVGRDPDSDCNFYDCPETMPVEEMEAEDEEQMEEEELAQGECPPGVNPREVKMCPDLSFVSRTGPNCTFAICP